MTTRLQSFDESQLGAFNQSQLDARNTAEVVIGDAIIYTMERAFQTFSWDASTDETDRTYPADSSYPTIPDWLRDPSDSTIVWRVTALGGDDTTIPAVVDEPGNVRHYVKIDPTDPYTLLGTDTSFTSSRSSYGIGGDSTTFWAAYASGSGVEIDKHNTSDFSAVSTGDVVSNFVRIYDLDGVDDGVDERLWAVGLHSDDAIREGLFELDPSDYSVINYVTMASLGITAYPWVYVGGKANTVFVTGFNTDRPIYFFNDSLELIGTATKRQTLPGHYDIFNLGGY